MRKGSAMWASLSPQCKLIYEFSVVYGRKAKMLWLLFHGNCCCCFQGSRPGVPTKEEGIRQMPRKSRGRARKSKQDSDRGAEGLKRHLSTQSRVSPLTGGGSGAACADCDSVLLWGCPQDFGSAYADTHAHKPMNNHTLTQNTPCPCY